LLQNTSIKLYHSHIQVCVAAKGECYFIYLGARIHSGLAPTAKAIYALTLSRYRCE